MKFPQRRAQEGLGECHCLIEQQIKEQREQVLYYEQSDQKNLQTFSWGKNIIDYIQLSEEGRWKTKENKKL